MQVETIGDAYMLASGLPKRNGEKHIREIADCSLDLLASVRDFKIPHQEDKQIKIRIGTSRNLKPCHPKVDYSSTLPKNMLLYEKLYVSG